MSSARVEPMQNLFGAGFDALLSDFVILTGTYFESPPPDDETDKRRFGYSRDKRSDCVRALIALIVTPEALPLAYQVLPGNTADCTTLRDALHKIEAQYGKAERTDRGIPTDALDAPGRSACLISSAHPRVRLSKLAKALLGLPWQAAREGIDIKLLPRGRSYLDLQITEASGVNGCPPKVSTTPVGPQGDAPAFSTGAVMRGGGWDSTMLLRESARSSPRSPKRSVFRLSSVNRAHMGMTRAGSTHSSRSRSVAGSART
jgi:hypothetical protein